MKLSKALDLYLTHLLERNLSPLHLGTVRSRLRQFVEPVEEFPTDFRDAAVGSVSILEIHRHFRQLEISRSDGTMAGYASTHRAFWAWCIENGLRDDSPAANLKRYSYLPKHRRAASPSAVALVIAALPGFVAQNDYHPRDVRDGLVVSLSLDSGNRIGEIRSLRRKYVEAALKGGEVGGNGRCRYQIIGTGKTGGQDMVFFNESADLARLWLNTNPFPKSEFMFVSLRTGHLLRRETMGRCFVRVCEFAEVPTIRSHAIRKRNASDIQMIHHDPELTRQFLGHTSIKTTMMHYNDVDRDRVSDVASELSSARRGDPLDMLFRPR